MCAFYVTHTSRALESHDLSGEGINSGSYNRPTFLTIQGHRGPPRMRDQLNAGATPRQHKHERRYVPSTHPFMLTSRIWKDDYDSQIIGHIRGPYGTKPSWHLSYRWGKTPKKPHPGTCPDWGSNPGPLPDKRPCYRLLHSFWPNFNM